MGVVEACCSVFYFLFVDFPTYGTQCARIREIRIYYESMASVMPHLFIAFLLNTTAYQLFIIYYTIASKLARLQYHC